MGGGGGQPHPPVVIGGHLLDLPGIKAREKNTFLEFILCDGASKSEAPPPPEPVTRSSTEPVAAARIAQQAEDAALERSFSGETPAAESTPYAEQVEEPQELQERALLAKLLRGEEETLSAPSSSSSPPPSCEGGAGGATPQGGLEACSSATWRLTSSFLQSKDTRQSRTLELPDLADGCPGPKLVVTIFPKAANKRRGGACFRAAKGKGHIHVKWSSSEAVLDKDVALLLSVGTQTLSGGWQEHNFVRSPVCRFPDEWDFEAAIDDSTGQVSVTLSASLATPGRKIAVGAIGGAAPALSTGTVRAAAPFATETSMKASSSAKVFVYEPSGDLRLIARYGEGGLELAEDLANPCSSSGGGGESTAPEVQCTPLADAQWSGTVTALCWAGSAYPIWWTDESVYMEDNSPGLFNVFDCPSASGSASIWQ